MKHFFDFTNLVLLIKNPKNKMIIGFVAVFLIGIILLFSGKLQTFNVAEEGNTKDKNSDDMWEKNTAIGSSFEGELEQRLTNMLKEVSGIGDVKIMITLENETLLEPAFNTVNTEKTSEEKDTEGGVRTIVEKQTNKQVVLLRRNGDDQAVNLQKIAPKIKGILIIAEGAFSSKIKDKIIKSTSTLFDIPIYRISILEK